MEIIFDTEKEKNMLYKILAVSDKCPASLNLSQSCAKRCDISECWKRAFRNMEVKKKDYRKKAEKMICSGDIVKSEFFDILADELAKQLEEDDNKKGVK